MAAAAAMQHKQAAAAVYPNGLWNSQKTVNKTLTKNSEQVAAPPSISAGFCTVSKLIFHKMDYRDVSDRHWG